MEPGLNRVALLLCVLAALFAVPRQAEAELIVEIAGKPAADRGLKRSIVAAVSWRDIATAANESTIRLRTGGRVEQSLFGPNAGRAQPLAPPPEDRKIRLRTRIYYSDGLETAARTVAKYLSDVNIIASPEKFADQRDRVLLIGEPFDLSVTIVKASLSSDGSRLSVEFRPDVDGAQGYGIELRENGTLISRDPRRTAGGEWVFDYDVPRTWSGSVRDFAVTIDPQNQFAERNEGNNIDIIRVEFPAPVEDKDGGDRRDVNTRPPSPWDELIEDMRKQASRPAGILTLTLGGVLFLFAVSAMAGKPKPRKEKAAPAARVFVRPRADPGKQSIEPDGESLVMPCLRFRASADRGEVSMEAGNRHAGDG